MFVLEKSDLFLKIGLFQVIKTELFRNIGLSMACVFVTMLLLLADIWGSVLTMICVVMSLIDVMGYMQAWGLTIDVVSSVIVIISIGLCVDYSAHIAHAFLTSKGMIFLFKKWNLSYIEIDQDLLFRDLPIGDLYWFISNFCKSKLISNFLKIKID